MKFNVLCDLLHRLECISTREPPLSPKLAENSSRKEILQWFQSHRTLIDDPSTDAVALLSSLLPQRRTDRVYNFQPPSLTRVIGRCLGLGSSRQRDLGKWKEARGGDLATCVERVLREAEHSVPSREVTVEEVDHVLNEVARRSRFSCSEIREKYTEDRTVSVDTELAKVYHRLQSREAKWFTRMILKDFSPVIFPEDFVLRCFHHLLPSVLKVHDNFHVAIAKLRSPGLGWVTSTANAQEARIHKCIAASILAPVIGTKIGRPFFLKARSIKHTVKLAHDRKMSLERKYDGEYCQIHINLQKTGAEIQIFSKSAKDSTNDRTKVHSMIKECLKIGKEDCGFSNQCILEGELLLWHDEDKRIMDFHKIRKHISRSGSFLGTAADSQPHPWECLIVVFYDVMLIDGESMLHQPYSLRRKRLESLVTSVAGKPVLAQNQEIDFKNPNAPNLLICALAAGFAQKWEGFVLKPFNEPYVNLEEHPRHMYPSCWIKLKKDYIPNLGDTIDLAIIGAGYRVTKGVKATATHLQFTHFHIGCLMNKEDVLRCGVKPKFLVLDAFNQCISVADLRKLCQLGEFQGVKVDSIRARSAFDFSVSAQAEYECKMDMVFPVPFVFEMLCSGFDKPANREYLTPRFPRLLKIHWDRGFKDSLGFTELQTLAKEAMNMQEGDLSEDISTWVRKLEGSVKNGNKWWSDSGLSVDNLDSNSADDGSDVTGLAKKQQLDHATFGVRTRSQESQSSKNHPELDQKISEQSSSRPLMNITSRITLPTPPTSSNNSSRQVQHEANSSSYKRRRKDIEDNSHVKRSIKRPRLEASSMIENHVPSNPEPKIPNGLGHSRPLSVITNSARPYRLLSNVKAPNYTSSVQLPLSEQSLKVRSSTQMKMCKTKRIIPSPSIAVQRNTTASDYNKVLETASLREVPTPAFPLPSSHHTTIIPMDIKSELPIFLQSFIILSPCISEMSYLKNLRRPSQATYMTSEDFLQGRPPEISDRSMILLVDSHRYKPTADFLRNIFPVVGGLGREVEIWDWRVLEHNNTKRRLLFVGCLRMDGEGRARVDWSGGHVTKFVHEAQTF